MMIKTANKYPILLAMILIVYGCKNEKPHTQGFHFTLMDNAGIDFNNKITESDSVNVYVNEYMYNGSGVGIGDFNNDGLQDIFFAGSMVSSKLYLNKGNFQFEDITEKAGVQTSKWCTGVSVIDINNDGFPDIYVSSSHSADTNKRKNLLFINDGKLHFSEQAAEYGLADTGYSTQAVFFDYDRDGDVDMYLLNHRLYNRNANNLVPKDTSGFSPANDRLYRNDGVPAGQTHPVFHDVTIAAGIKEDGYGLGVVITDVNNDDWPDIYVANDYIGNDVLWLNNHNGSFSNIIASAIRHQSYNSMGVDAADINNDGLPDLAVLDMLPETNERKKMMFSSFTQERHDMEQRMGYQPAFVRNMLQLNNGTRTMNDREEPYYSEIGQLAGISETDWSWSVLMADFDNDGWKDMHVTNGIARDVTNNDYVAFRNDKIQGRYSFGEKNDGNPINDEMVQMLRKNLDQYGSVKVENYFFHNNKNLRFTNTTAEMNMNIPSVSNGAAYADLDNDGDLDLVVNNMNQPAFVWKNETRTSINDSTNNFVSIQLKGPAGNTSGIGAKVYLQGPGINQALEQSPVRGFCSSVDQRLHFGIGDLKAMDLFYIVWPDGNNQVVRDVKVNQFLVVEKGDGEDEPARIPPHHLFHDITGQMNIDFTHKESKYFDFGYQRALPQKYSQLGPCLASVDVNGDGLMDFFVGGAAYQSGKIFMQQSNGNFTAKDLVTGTKSEEDLAAVFFDADGDKDPDLLITGGSTEYAPNLPYNHPRLYNNDGKGNFTLNKEAIPVEINDISSVVTVSDIDGDGDQDIFIGGRVLSGKYPQSPRSYVLQNNGGRFTDITKTVCPALEFGGMLTGAVFTDFNRDQQPDLVICGEWMPVRFFVNEKGTLKEITEQTGLGKINGQWRSLQAGDIDGDGDVDFVAGNMGLNNRFHISATQPLRLYAGDFDNNNSIDRIPAYYIRNNKNEYELFPALDRNQLADQLPSIKKKFLLHEDYAKTNMQSLLKNISAKDMIEKDCETTASVWIENLGNGKFASHELPVEAQFAPVNAILISDFNNDGLMDILLAGNEYQEEVSTGRYDASYGTYLQGTGKGEFKEYYIHYSGFIVDGDTKCLLELKNNKKEKFILAGVNDSHLKCFKIF